jgi:hypothetical protein
MRADILKIGGIESTKKARVAKAATEEQTA